MLCSWFFYIKNWIVADSLEQFESIIILNYFEFDSDHFTSIIEFTSIRIGYLYLNEFEIWICHLSVVPLRTYKFIVFFVIFSESIFNLWKLLTSMSGI